MMKTVVLAATVSVVVSVGSVSLYNSMGTGEIARQEITAVPEDQAPRVMELSIALEKMRAVQPQLKELQEKHKDDKQAQSEAMMKL